MHQNLSGSLSAAIEQSEKDGGIWIKDLVDGDTVWVRTQNTVYRIRKINGTLTAEGHAKLCPLPVEVNVIGSTWGGSMIKAEFIGVGMHMEFYIPNHGTVTTSRIVSVENWGKSCYRQLQQ